MSEDDDTPIMGVRKIATELGYRPVQVRHMVSKGVLPVTRIGARVATTRRLLTEWRAGVEERARKGLADRQAGAKPGTVEAA